MLRGVGAGVLALLLTACEAPLDLGGVNQRLSEPVRRSDQFQAATVSRDTLVVVGNQGLVLTSPDHGTTWLRAQLPGWPALISVTSCPDGTLAALAAEGEIWVSADDGASWAAWAIETEEAPQDVTCDPKSRLWVVGSFSSIFWSEDAGQTWDETSLDEDLILSNIQFIDGDTAYITGEFGTVLKTVDGGANWEILEPLEHEFYPLAMYFADHDHGWVVGLQGQVLHTGDGGLSWSLQESGTRAPLFGIAPAGTDLFAVGGEGTLQRLQNGHWGSVDHGKPILLYLRAVHAVGDDRLLVAGQAGALHVLPLHDLVSPAGNPVQPVAATAAGEL